MADGPPDEYNFDPATGINTNDRFLRDGEGNPVMGEGVKANLDGLEGYSKNVNKLSTNFRHMAQSVTGPMQGMITAAFMSEGQGLPWASNMARLAGHNLRQITEFNGQIAIGAMNIASAAQVVANVYRDTDAANAGRFDAIEFAFGDMSKAHDSIPKEVLDNLDTWQEFNEKNPGFAAAHGAIPTGEPKVETVGNKTTTTVVIPLGDGKNITMVTVEERWEAPDGSSGVNTTVMYNNQVQTVTTERTIGSTTTTRTTTSYYNEDGTKKHDRVTSESQETWEVEGEGETTTLRTDTETTTYEYDDKGNETDSTTTENSVAVGAEHPTQPFRDPKEDPYYIRRNQVQPMPEPG